MIASEMRGSISTAYLSEPFESSSATRYIPEDVTGIDGLKKMHSRLRYFRPRCQCFCTAQNASKPSSSSDGGSESIIRSGGKSSYIGFGKFEGFGSEIGSISKALDYLKEVMKAHTAGGIGPENLRVQARGHHDIAMCHHRGGDVDAAISEYKIVIELLEKCLLATSPSAETVPILKRARFDLSSAFSGLSVALADKSSDAEALEYALKSLEIRKAIMGPNHPSVGECLNNIGGLYFRQSNFNKAAEMYQESLGILLTKTGGKEENKYVALAYYNIGLTYDRLGLKKGRDAVYKALLIADHIWGPNHDQTLQISKSFQEMKR